MLIFSVDYMEPFVLDLLCVKVKRLWIKGGASFGVKWGVHLMRVAEVDTMKLLEREQMRRQQLVMQWIGADSFNSDAIYLLQRQVTTANKYMTF